MDYSPHIRRAVDFIEANLKSPIRLPHIAREACLSRYHFHRIFQAMTGESAAAYIRKRRLTAAACELLTGGLTVLDLALDYRFESQAAFTRAFKKQFRETPGRYRSRGIGGTVFEKAPLLFERLEHLKSGLSLVPQIVLEGERVLAGMRTMTSLENNRVFALWESFLPRITELDNIVEAGVSYGVHEVDEEGSIISFNGESELSYLAAVEWPGSEHLPGGLVSRLLPEQLYARFTHKGSLARLEESYAYIYGSWLAGAPYELSCGYDYERFDGRFTGIDDDNSELEIYIAIKERP